MLAALPKAAVATRSNDGLAAPWGGKWISTIGLQTEPKAGAICRFEGGRLTQLYDRNTIPNAICFDPTAAPPATATPRPKPECPCRISCATPGFALNTPWVGKMTS